MHPTVPRVMMTMLPLLLTGIGAGAAEGNLRVTVSEPWTATSQPALAWNRDQRGPARCWLPHMHQGLHGEIILSHSLWEDDYYPPEPPEPCAMFRSTDGGKTWESQGQLPGRTTLGGVLRDGALLQLSYLAEEREPGRWAMMVRRSTDAGKTWTLEKDVPLRVPQAVRYGKPENNQGVYLDGNLIELDDGLLLASAYGPFAGDKQTRSYLVCSRDRGRTWEYYATIAAAPDLGSCDETSIVRTKDGRLLAMMRVASGQPMWQCYSSDNGLTWSKPTATRAPSVEPDLRLMSNGILACSYGRPGAWIMFSASGNGDDWSAHTQLDPCPSWDYTSIVEISPGVLLYAYDQQGLDDPATGQKVNAIRLRTVTVQRP